MTVAETLRRNTKMTLDDQDQRKQQRHAARRGTDAADRHRAVVEDVEL